MSPTAGVVAGATRVTFDDRTSTGVVVTAALEELDASGSRLGLRCAIASDLGYAGRRS
jgi:hypothetical protein